jgi:hypothetical protein
MHKGGPLFGNQEGRIIIWGDKISEAKKGTVFSEEHKKKLSVAKKGKTPWNKGLNKEIDERVKKYGEHARGNHFQRKGIRPKNLSFIQQNRRIKILDEKMEEIRNMRRSGMKLIDIAKKFNCGIQPIYTRVQDIKIKRSALINE